MSRSVIRLGIEVHRALGPGLLESVYETCLGEELAHAGVQFRKQVAVPVFYRGIEIEDAYRLDLLVEDVLVVEIKAVSRILPIHKAQLLTYLRLLDCPLGLVLNFHVPLLIQGVTRLVNDFPRGRAA